MAGFRHAEAPGLYLVVELWEVQPTLEYPPPLKKKEEKKKKKKKKRR